MWKGSGRGCDREEQRTELWHRTESVLCRSRSQIDRRRFDLIGAVWGGPSPAK